MSIFKHAIKNVIENEGGYVNNEKDLGGVTKYGISLRFLKTIDVAADKEKIQSLTQEEAEDIYFQYFWLANKYQNIDSQEVANKVFDTSINIGSKMANRFLQQSINILISEANQQLVEDGIIGNKTIGLTNLLKQEDMDIAILKIYSLLQKEYYTKIIINRPDQMVFLKGWFNRASK